MEARELMPYRPTPAALAANKKRYEATRELSDDEVFGSGPELSDDEVFGAAPEVPLSREERMGWDAVRPLDAITLGYGPEIVGGAMSLMGGDYEQERQKLEKTKGRYNEQVPFWDATNLMTGALGLAGGIGPATGLMKGAGLVSKGVRGAAGLAPTATSKSGKAVQALTDLGLTGAAAGGIYESSEVPGSVTQKLASIRPSAVAGAAGLVLGPLGYGSVKLAQTGRNLLLPYEQQAARYIAGRLGKVTPDELAAEHAAAVKSGKPVVLADVGPKGVKDTAGVVAREPGEGREIAQKVLVDRQQGQVQRVGEDVGQAAGGKPGSFAQTVDDLQTQRAEAARPLYAQAMHSRPLQSAKLVEIAARPSGKAAMQRGLKMAQDEGIPESELVSRDKKGNITGYTTKALHYMKMGLDDMIEASKRSGDNSAARAFSIMKNELLGEMDRLNPAYAKARQVFAGHAANQNALEKGRQAVHAHPDQIRQEMSEMSAGELAFYRKGYAQRVIETVEASPDKGNAVNRIFGNTSRRERLRAVLGDGEFGRLQKRLGLEQSMYDTYATANVGSATAERIAQSQDLEAHALGEFGPAVIETGITGQVGSLIKKLTMSGVARLLSGLHRSNREAIARMLFSQDPAKVKVAIALIRKEYAGIAARQAGLEAGGAVAATAPGGKDAAALGGAVALDQVY